MANVSVSTVSRVLNDKDTKAASPEVRERVWKIVRETGYIPNTNAQSLRNAKSGNKTTEGEKKNFACIYARSQDKQDMFFAELAKAIEYEAFKKNYMLKTSFYVEDLEDARFASSLEVLDIKGIVVLGRFDKERINIIAEKLKNVVYVGLNFTSHKHDVVFCDGFKAGLKAMEVLMELGHRKIAYIGDMNKENRYRAYCEALSAQGLKPERNLIINVKQGLNGGHQGANELLKKGAEFSAVFCANDATAMGAIKGFQENGYQVPNDISVIGIDDIEMASYVTPMLTTVHIPIDELGRQAAKTLIDRIEKGHSLPLKMELPFSLAKRDSCAKFKKTVSGKKEKGE